jgi:hypothetical protein
MPLSPRTRLGAYVVVSHIGSGGMGEVYLAEDSRLGRRVALKVLPPHPVDSPDRRARFEREARAAAALNHPNICTIYDVGEAAPLEDSAGSAGSPQGTSPDGGALPVVPFIAMEYIEGVTLTARLRQLALGVGEAVDFGLQIADALDEAHRRRIVHRDLKSDNVLVTARGQLKILDFGLAKELPAAGTGDAQTVATVSQVGVVVGTPAYMSPEQALGRALDGRSDLFSFGVVLYELLTGHLPFDGRTHTERIDALLHADPPPVARFNDDAPESLVRLVRRMLEKNPDDRTQTAREVWNGLREVREELGGGRLTTPSGLRSAASGTRGAPSGVRASGVRSSAARRSGSGAGAVSDERPRVSWKVAAAAGVAVLVVGGTAAGLWWWLSRAASPSGAASIVVLPAEVHGPAEFEKYQDSVPGTLSGYLTQIDGLVIKGPPTSSEFERVQRDVATVLRVYGGATHVIQTVVRAEGGRMNVSVRLQESATHRLVKVVESEETTENYPRLMRQAAEAVRQTLRPEAASVGAAAGSPTADAAVAAYRDGLFYWNRYNQGSQTVPSHEESDFAVAKTALEHALALDPKMADAAARIAHLHAFRFEALRQPADVEQAESWAGRAIAIHPKNGLAWSALSFTVGMRPVSRDTFKQTMAIATRRALKAASYAPDDGFVVHHLTSAESYMVRLAASEEAERLDPLYLYAPRSKAWALVALNRPREAQAFVERVLAREAAAAQALLDVRIEILAALGRTDEAAPLLVQFRGEVKAGRWPPLFLLLRETELLVASEDPAAESTLRKLMTAGPSFEEPLVSLMAQHGRRDLVFKYWEGSQPFGFLIFDVLETDSRLDSLRSDPRFPKMRARAREEYSALVGILDEAKAQGELPKFVEPVLVKMHGLLK